jgi:hypothetical protein
MTVRQFAVQVDGVPSEAQLNALFDRCDDVVVERDPASRRTWILVDRLAPSLMDAIVSVIRDLDFIGAVTVGVRDDDDLVTLPVVAERIGRPPDAAAAWLTDPAGFPRPVFTGGGEPLYRWSAIAPWLRSRLGVELPSPEPTLTAVNLALRLRALAPRVERMAALRSLIAG